MRARSNSLFRRISTALLGLFCCGVAWMALGRTAQAQTFFAPEPSSNPEPIEQLKAHADTASGGEQAKLCLEYAHRMLEAANTQFTNGDVDKGQGEIQQVIDYALKAANAATGSGKRLKQTEIGLRELAKRMHDIQMTLSLDDRPPLGKGVDQIERARTELLTKMFGPPEPKEKS